MALEALEILSSSPYPFPAGAGEKEDLEGRGASDVLDRAFSKTSIRVEDRALTTELVYGVLRHQGYLDAWISQFAKPGIRRVPPKVLLPLRVGLYQLLFLQRVPAFAAVNTTVQWVKRHAGTRAAGLTNAILREVVRHPEKFSLPDPTKNPLQYLEVKYSHPSWMVRRWFSRLGQTQTEALLLANNAIPPLTLRANALQCSRETLMQEVQQAGGKARLTTVSPVGVVVQGVSPRQLPSYAEGGFYLQDEAAQLIAYLVDPKPGERILDACAAPGGKTTHLLEQMGGCGEVVAWDVSTARIRLLKQNLQRMKEEKVKVLRRNALKPLDPIPFDRILVDAPCSALGTLRRNPDGKWHKKESIIAFYATQQQRILEGVAPLLKGGGRLVYVSCSTEPEENEKVIEAFLLVHPEFERVPARLPMGGTGLIDREGYVNTLLNPQGMDFFFAACLTKRS